jgi:hypothetical protein
MSLAQNRAHTMKKKNQLSLQNLQARKVRNGQKKNW